MKTNHMKIAVVALTLAVLAGCNKSEREAPSADVSTPTTASAEVSPATASVMAPALTQEYIASPATVPGGHCFLDAINGSAIEGASAKVGQEVSFGGWVADINSQVPTAALLVLEGKDKSYSVPLVAGGERPDVAAALANPALNNSGYNVTAKLEAVVPGDYALAIVVGSDQAARCELNAKLTVED